MIVLPRFYGWFRAVIQGDQKLSRVAFKLALTHSRTSQLQIQLQQAMEPSRKQLLGLSIAIDEAHNIHITPESSSALLWPWRSGVPWSGVTQGDLAGLAAPGGGANPHLGSHLQQLEPAVVIDEPQASGPG
jgi:hypothetical protein